MITVKHRHSLPKITKKFSDFLFSNMKSDDIIEGIHLGGAHAKGLSNKKSDYDIRVYYKRPLSSLITMKPKGLEFYKPFFKLMHENNGNTFMEWGGEEFELVFIPLFSISAKKQLFKSLAKQNGDFLYKLHMGIPIYQTRLFTSFLEELDNTFIWEQYKPKGFFHGYMKSQSIKSGDRARDYARAVRKAKDSGSVSPIVKQIIEAINIGLQGISFLTDQTFYGDFWKLYERYGDILQDEHQFIETIYEHKTDKRVIPANPQFFLESEKMRADIFNKLSAEIKMTDSSLPYELSPSQQRNNLKFLDRWLGIYYRS